MVPQRTQTFSKVCAQPVFFLQSHQVGLCQLQRLSPLGIFDLGVDIGGRQGVGEFTATARGEGHGEHVVGGGQGVGAAAVCGEGEVAGVHVGVADQRAEGVQQAGGGMGVAGDVALGGEAGGDGGPAAAAEADEFGVHGAERDEAAPTVRADAVEAFDFKKTLPAVIDDARGDGGDTPAAQQRERVVFGQQQVAPTLGDGVVVVFAHRQRELDQHMARAVGGGDIGAELGLFAAGGGSRGFAGERRAGAFGVGLGERVGRQGGGVGALDEMLAPGVAEDEVADGVVARLAEQGAQNVFFLPVAQAAGQPEAVGLGGDEGAPEKALRPHVVQPPGKAFAVAGAAVGAGHDVAGGFHRAELAERFDPAFRCDAVDRNLRRGEQRAAQCVLNRSVGAEADDVIAE